MLSAVYALALLITAEPPSDEVAKSIRAANQVLNKAFADGNAKVLKDLMTDDHVAITSYYNGPMNRAEQIASIADTKVTEYKFAGVAINMLAKDVALVRYEVTMAGTYKGRPLPSRVYAAAVWVNQAGT